MTAQYLPAAVIGVVLVLFIIYRQLVRRPVEGRQLIVVPLAFTILGLYDLTQNAVATSAALGALVASLASALVFGLARGWSMRVWQEAARILRQGTAFTVALWIISIGLRLGIGALARRAGVGESVTLGELPLFFGVTLAAQNLVVWKRAQAIGASPRPQS